MHVLQPNAPGKDLFLVSAQRRQIFQCRKIVFCAKHRMFCTESSTRERNGPTSSQGGPPRH